MPAAVERSVEPHRHDRLGELERDDASADREHVGVVVGARQPGGVEIVAQRGAGAVHLVRRDLFTLTAAADDDAAIGLSAGDETRDLGADRRIVDGGFGMRAAVLDHVAEPRERGEQVLLQREPRMIGPDRDAHIVNYIDYPEIMPTVTITRKGEDRARGGHPWIYRSDVETADADAGDVVQVVGTRGRPIGHALFSDRSEITLRMIAFGSSPMPDGFIADRLAAAMAFRDTLGLDATAYRLVHGEADRLPSLIVDRYGDYLVVQALSQGVDRRLAEIVAALVRLAQPKGILARNDPRVRLLEGLEQRVEVLHGEVPERIEVREGAVEYQVDPWRGQKTGLFLDQRENREAALRYARGRLLDAFSYNGGFALALAPRCTSVLAIDISDDAVARIRANAARNGLAHVEARAMNVFDELRELERTGARFDTIVLDPPAFAKNKASVPKALSGYKEINLRALKLLEPGGFLVTCSCSYNVSESMFLDVVARAAADAGVEVSLVEKRAQGRDHPILISVPETYYLKCLILRKLA